MEISMNNSKEHFINKVKIILMDSLKLIQKNDMEDARKELNSIITIWNANRRSLRMHKTEWLFFTYTVHRIEFYINQMNSNEYKKNKLVDMYLKDIEIIMPLVQKIYLKAIRDNTPYIYGPGGLRDPYSLDFPGAPPKHTANSDMEWILGGAIAADVLLTAGLLAAI